MKTNTIDITRCHICEI